MSDDKSNSIINLGGLAKPATILIEKISSAIGGIAKPWQIIRVANAESKASIIKAESDIKIHELQKRAMTRFLNEETIKQKNIEDITKKALPELKEDSKPQDLENDWIANFFNECRLISDPDMQTIWARILAGEANLPNSYSKRAIKNLSILDKKDVELFTNLNKFKWVIGDNITPLIYNYKDDIYKKYNIDFDSLNHLSHIGLIQFEVTNVYGGEFTFISPSVDITCNFFGNKHYIKLKKSDEYQVIVGAVIFTQVGIELSKICDFEPLPDIEKFILNHWKKVGYIK